MTYTCTLTSKGQVTIPKAVRIRLGLKEGERIEFVTDGDQTIVRPARTKESPFAAYAGILDTFPGGIPEINGWVSAMRDDEE
jgi:hypothetical protein